jgi:hypothetical protein
MSQRNTTLAFTIPLANRFLPCEAGKIAVQH